jgi:hypothetical protein
MLGNRPDVIDHAKRHRGHGLRHFVGAAEIEKQTHSEIAA